MKHIQWSIIVFKTDLVWAQPGKSEISITASKCHNASCFVNALGLKAASLTAVDTYGDSKVVKCIW